MVDILRRWTQRAIVRNKTASRVIERIREAEKILPFSIKGLDFDNGKEFLNDEMLALRPARCIKNKHTEGKSRALKKHWMHHNKLLQ